MYWLPARPSPIAAPIAPPPSARPPPTIAPARATACCMFCTAMCWSPSRWRATSVALLVYGKAEIGDGEQGKDQRLNAADEHVEKFPDRVRQPKHVRREQPDQRDHQPPGEQVAEQSQRERERLRALFDGTERNEPTRRAREALHITAGTLFANARQVRPAHDQNCHRGGQVDVRGRRRDVLLRRNDFEPVRDQDEREQRDREWDDERRRLDAHGGLDLVPDVVDEGLERKLQLAGHAR